MDGVMLIAAFILCTITIFIVVYMANATKQEKTVNKVHFYVVRNKNGDLWLYIGKPIRGLNVFSSPLSHMFALPCSAFNHLGLNKKDYDYLKWEDEPVEVFVNMED